MGLFPSRSRNHPGRNNRIPVHNQRGYSFLMDHLPFRCDGDGVCPGRTHLEVFRLTLISLGTVTWLASRLALIPLGTPAASRLAKPAKPFTEDRRIA